MFSDVLSWVVTFITTPFAMNNYTLCGHFVELSLCTREPLTGPGCFCWKTNRTKFDHLGNTGGHWKPLVAAFLSHLEVSWRFKVNVRLLLSPSGDLGIGLVWDNNRTGPDHISVWLLKSSSNWTKPSMMGPQLFLGWYQMILDVETRFRLGSDKVQTRFRLGSD